MAEVKGRRDEPGTDQARAESHDDEGEQPVVRQDTEDGGGYRESQQPVAGARRHGEADDGGCGMHGAGVS
jgi:hypothetical protein